jgi:hypothetical protein
VEIEASPATVILEAAATTVGVGMVLGGFVAGLIGVLRGAQGGTLELRALKAGYAFAAGCLVVRVVDVVRTI